MARKKPNKRTGVQLGEGVVRGMVMMAGVRVFAELGYRAASVEDLLAAAKISRRTFYKAFASKEDVGLALYTFGTDNLVESFRHAVSGDADLVAKVTRCIDLHLANAANRGRLVYVLGGEAGHQDSPLFAVRMRTHDRLAEMLVAAGDRNVDPLFVKTLIFAIEAIVRCVLAAGDEGRKVSPASFAQARRVLLRIVTGAVAGEGPLVTELPLLA